MLSTKTPLFYAKQALRLHYFNCTEQWKQPFPSPELLLLYIHYHSANGQGEQYDIIKVVISRLYILSYLNYICKSIILQENLKLGYLRNKEELNFQLLSEEAEKKLVWNTV